jgi:hypothetical protein
MNIATVTHIDKKKIVELFFKEVMITNIIDIEDVLIIKLKDFKFIIDEVI